MNLLIPCVGSPTVRRSGAGEKGAPKAATKAGGQQWWLARSTRSSSPKLSRKCN